MKNNILCESKHESKQKECRLQVSIQTKGLIDIEHAESGFAQIKQAGFDCIDLNLDVFLNNTDIYNSDINTFFDKTIIELQEYFHAWQEMMEKYQITASQMHAPYPIQVYGKEEQNRYMMHEVIPKSLAIAGYLNIPYVVIHPIKLQYQAGREEERRQNIEYFQTLIPLVKEHKLTICFENLYETIGNRIVEGVCAEPKEAVWYIDTLNAIAGEELFGFCLDTGHLQLVKRKPYDTMIELGNRLKILHIHENDGVGDLHQLPYTFAGEKNPQEINPKEIQLLGFDWEGFIRGLRENGYRGVLNFETFPCINSFPGAVTGHLLKTIERMGRYIAKEIEHGR